LKRLAADMAYGTRKFLSWLVKQKKVTPHIPVSDKNERDDGTYSRSDFFFAVTGPHLRAMLPCEAS
jgi:hypothetical protein